mgnify:CR=1 FL=1
MTRPVHALLLHGAGGGAWQWGLWMPVLQAHGIHARAIDLPHRCSAAPSGWQDALDTASHALEALPRPRVVAGASLGGLLAAACAPLADAAVLLNPLPPSPWSRSLAPPTGDTRRWGTDARLASTRASLHDADPATALAAFRRWRDCPVRLLREAREVVLERVDVPMRMLACDADADIPPDAMRAWARAWSMDIEEIGGSHAGVLLGSGAAAHAARTAGWLAATLRG